MGLAIGFGVTLALVLLAFGLVKVTPQIVLGPGIAREQTSAISQSLDKSLKVVQRLKTLKNDLDVGRAPKTDQNHYYGLYYRFFGFLLVLKIFMFSYLINYRFLVPFHKNFIFSCFQIRWEQD